MYATIRSYAGNSSLADHLVTRADDVRALIQGVPGFQAYYLIRTGDGTASITVCDDQAGTDEANRVAAEWLKANLPQAAGSPPEITAGAVVLSA